MDRCLDILVIDDDVGMTESLADVLELKGYNVEVANCGLEGIDKMKNQSFDCVLLDIKMPDMNGLEVFKQIKKITSTTPVVMMTAYVLPELIGQAKKEGVLAVLRKPLDIDSVIRLLEKFEEESAVLIVDDNRKFCESLQDCLLARGYKTDFTTDALHAIDMVCKTNYDYVFLDVKLDRVNGLDVMKVIKRITPEVIVILMTAYQQEMKDYIKEGLTKSAYACLHKPFEMDNILEMLDDVRHKKMSESLDYV